MSKTATPVSGDAVFHPEFRDKLACIQFRGPWLYITGHSRRKATEREPTVTPEPLQFKVDTPEGEQLMPVQAPFLLCRIVDEDEDEITVRYKDERSNPNCQMLTRIPRSCIFTITVVESVEPASQIVVP